jgi:hypothetical protein
MAITQPFTGNPTISTTEWSFTNASTSIAAQTSPGVYQFWADVAANVVAGDEFRFALYEKVNGGTQRLVETWDVQGKQLKAFTIPPMILTDGWDFTCIRLAGADRVIPFAVRKIG